MNGGVFDQFFRERFREFYLKTPEDILVLKISIICVIIGVTITSLALTYPNYFPEFTVILVLLFTIIVGINSIISGIFLLIDYKDISYFKQINKIIVSDYGFFLYKKDGTTATVIPWQNIKSIEFRGLEHFLGFIKIGRDPLAIILNLVDGTTFNIPIYQILKAADRLKMAKLVEREGRRRI
jgi:hypothetical protein